MEASVHRRAHSALAATQGTVCRARRALFKAPASSCSRVWIRMEYISEWMDSIMHWVL